MVVNYEHPGDGLALDLLSFLGNSKPALAQMKLMRKLINQVSIPQQVLFDNRLTPQEQNCLFYAAHGYSIKETAALLNCEIPTIKYYRKAILRKLNCTNMTHATLVGVRYGYLFSRPISHKKLIFPIQKDGGNLS